MALSFPVRKRDTACLVRATLSVGNEVLRINTAHSINVVGGFVVGTIGSSISRAVGNVTASTDFRGGGGSANSTIDVSHA